MKKVKLAIWIFLVLNISVLYGQNNSIGIWLNDEYGLPAFNYTGALPYTAKTPNGKDVKLPDDPWFLLGNYQLTLFTHVSGIYELITGQRAWGRLNQGDKPNSGLNNASIILQNKAQKNIKTYQLAGSGSLAADPGKCKRVFGCGFAYYAYQTDELAIKRVLSVKPSSNPYNGSSAFLLTVKIKNISGKRLNLVYHESVTSNYETMQQQKLSPDSKKVKYINSITVDRGNQIIKADIRGSAADPLLFPAKETISQYEGFPPALFIKALTSDVTLKAENNRELEVEYQISVKSGEEKTIEMIIGYTFENEYSSIAQIVKDLSDKGKISKPAAVFNSEAAFTANWLKVLPGFEDEKDSELKRELIWHAYNLECMATYSEFYHETKIPQGTIYDYDWGNHASARDNFQHALPLVYYNPSLAKSVLRYMLKRTTPWGEIRLIEMGNGYANNYSYFTSDQQLFFFLLLSEYLKVTKDYKFLDEEIECYPVQKMPKMKVVEFVKNCFTFLRDEIGTGSHGLVRLMNSDWNDAVYYAVDAPYNKVLFSGESHMNSAMAITILGSLLTELDVAQQKEDLVGLKQEIRELSKSMSIFRDAVLKSFFDDLGGRTYSRRMYFNGKSYGDENMFLEPQGYMMQINELPIERKKALYEEMKKRVYKGEKLGAREQQIPEFEADGWEKGSRENGGFWYALNGPVIIGMAQFDKNEAMKLLKMMTFANFSKAFPNYWTSYWSAADNIESSLIPEEGLPDQTWAYSDIPVYCAHPHAWILYCYYKIKKN